MNPLSAVAVAVILAAGMSLGYADDRPESVLLKGHTKAVTTLAWAADGKKLATAGDDRTIQMWDPLSGKQTEELPWVPEMSFRGPVVAFSDGLEFAAVKYIHLRETNIVVRTVSDGKVLFTINAMDTINKVPEGEHRGGFRPDVFAMAFSPDGTRLATAGSVAAVGGRHGLPGGIVILWDTQTGKIVRKSDKLSTAASSVAWSADGKRFAVGTNGAGGELPEPGELKVYDAKTGKVLHTFQVKDEVEQGEWASAGDVAFAPDGERVAAPVTAGSRGAPAGLLISDAGASVRVWNLRTGKSTQPVKGLKASVGRVVFSPNGKSLAMAGRDKVMRVWHLESGKEIVALSCPDWVTAVAFRPDGQSLAVGCRDGSVRIVAVPAAK